LWEQRTQRRALAAKRPLARRCRTTTDPAPATSQDRRPWPSRSGPSSYVGPAALGPRRTRPSPGDGARAGRVASGPPGACASALRSGASPTVGASARAASSAGA